MEKKYKITYAKALHGKEELNAVKRVLDSNATILGKCTHDFELQVAKLFGKQYGVMVNSGSSALMLAARLLALPKGSEFITPILTFSTTIAPFIQQGLVPVFVDVDPSTYQINIGQLEALITKKTKALVIPSLIGNLPDLARLQAIAKKHQLYFIEDSCDTLGATFNKKPTGSFSDISLTSFYGSHIITAAGNGGMLCVNDKAWDRRARILRGWGRSSSVIDSEDVKKRFEHSLEGKPYDAKFLFEEVGYNFLPSEIGAAFGLEQLKKLAKFKKIRQENFQKLLEFFAPYGHFFVLPKELPGTDTAWLAFPLTIRAGAPFSRFQVVQYLEQHGIQTRPIFTGNILRHPGFKNIKARRDKKGYPVADHITQNGFLIGCHAGIDKKQMYLLTNIFETFLKKHKPHG